jgi:hypothetical protein
MADDDRYRWLDEKAAERLLRGSSVNARSALPGGRPEEGQYDDAQAPPAGASGPPAGASGRQRASTPGWARGDAAADQYARAARLASVLDALVAEQTATPYALGAGRSGHPTGQPAELPGEAAAVEAFRAAHPETLHSGTVDFSAVPADAGTLVGRRAARQARGGRHGARRMSFGGRPLRAGFVMAVAGCALGGAAVAAGTGVLPTPFGGGSPTTSVSPMDRPSVDEASAQGGGSGGEDGTNGPRRGSRDGGTGPSGSPSEDGKDRGRGRDDNGKGWPYGDGEGLPSWQKREIAEDFCEPYENNQLSVEDRQRLEQVAGGPEDVDEFCDKYDDGWGGRGNSGGWGGSNGNGNQPNSGGNGHSGGWGDDGGGDGDSGGYSGGDDGGDGGGDDGGGGYPGGGDSGGTENGGGDGGDSGGDRQFDGSTPESGDGDSSGSAPSASPDRSSV